MAQTAPVGIAYGGLPLPRGPSEVAEVCRPLLDSHMSAPSWPGMLASSCHTARVFFFKQCRVTRFHTNAMILWCAEPKTKTTCSFASRKIGVRGSRGFDGVAIKKCEGRTIEKRGDLFKNSAIKGHFQLPPPSPTKTYLGLNDTTNNFTEVRERSAKIHARPNTLTVMFKKYVLYKLN